MVNYADIVFEEKEGKPYPMWFLSNKNTKHIFGMIRWSFKLNQYCYYPKSGEYTIDMIRGILEYIEITNRQVEKVIHIKNSHPKAFENV